VAINHRLTKYNPSIQLQVVSVTLCKVEFNQTSYWLYYVPNLHVFQQLVTLYLGRILVRVVSEIAWRNAQECARKNRDSRLDLAGDSWLQATRSCTCAKHAKSWSFML